MNYRGPYFPNTVCPVNCLIYTVQSPARSYPFLFRIHKFGLHSSNYSVCSCTNINANYPLHSQGFICCILPGLLRGVLSFRLKGRGRVCSLIGEEHPHSRQQGNQGLSTLFPLLAAPERKLGPFQVLPISSITGKHESQRLPRQKPQKALQPYPFLIQRIVAISR